MNWDLMNFAGELPQEIENPTTTGAELPADLVTVRIRRDGYDITGAQVSKEIVHAVTSLGADRAGPADLARIARGQWGIESVYWLRDTAYREDSGRDRNRLLSYLPL